MSSGDSERSLFLDFLPLRVEANRVAFRVVVETVVFVCSFVLFFDAFRCIRNRDDSLACDVSYMK